MSNNQTMDALEDAPVAEGDAWPLVWPHRQQLIEVARRYLRSAADAEDCVDDVLLRISQRSDLDPARVGGLLRTATVNACIDVQRGRQRRARMHSRLLRQVEGTEAEVEDAVVRRLTAGWVARHVERLPVQERAVLARVADGATIPQAASDLAISYKAADSSLTRARARLRPLLRSILVIGPVGLLRGIREGGRSAPVLATTTLVVMTLGLHQAQPTAPRMPEPLLVETHEAPAVDVVAPPSAPPVAGEPTTPTADPVVAADSSTQDQTSVSVTPPAGPTPEVVFDSGDVTPEKPSALDGLVEAGDVVITHEETDRTFTESVIACKDELRLTVQEVGCHPDW